MKALKIAGLGLVMVAGCNLMKKSDNAADGGPTSADSVAVAATASGASPSLLEKALSFVSGPSFEGEITMNLIEATKPVRTITYEVKGSKMRFDAPAESPTGGGTVIFDTSSKKITLVSDEKKTAMVMDLNGIDPAAAAAAAPGSTSTPTIDKTGKMDIVAGYSCEIWKVTETSGNHVEACVAKGIRFPSMGHRTEAWLSGLDDAFPLRAITSDATGKEKSRMEVTKIEKKSLDDAKFQVPAGYKTMDMAEMMKGLGGMPGAGGMPGGNPMMRPHR